MKETFLSEGQQVQNLVVGDSILLSRNREGNVTGVQRMGVGWREKNNER